MVRGWAFRDHTPEEKAAIRDYLETGKISENFPKEYATIDEESKEYYR